MRLAPGSLLWFARHELRLAWRDFLAMATAGRPVRAIALAAFAIVAIAIFHFLADTLVGPWAAGGSRPDRETLVLLTGGGLLAWTLMLSQALESVTRAYYGRGDLDLILASPAPASKLFAVRAGATGVITLGLSLLIAGPVINVLILRDGPHWLAAYAVLASLSLLGTALAVALTLLMFATIGPKRTRFVSQIVAAIVGAGFVIVIQAAAILAYGSMSRYEILMSEDLVSAAPEPESLLWLPARAAMGEPGPLALVVILCTAAFVTALLVAGRSFGRHAVAAGSVSRTRRKERSAIRFRAATQRQALRTKEWRLLLRDPWLLSQTLMQVLYLVPPALLLWINFGDAAGVFIVIVPVIVMACGQLAGGLAWLAISGEDAHDLVVTAPIGPPLVLRAKIEAVIGALAAVLAPVLLMLAIASPLMAAITGFCAALAAGSATAIQLWFRVPMRRSMFRRRQVASRLATLSEAFVSIMWAGVAALLAAGGWMALVSPLPALLAAATLGVAFALSPRARTT